MNKNQIIMMVQRRCCMDMDDMLNAITNAASKRPISNLDHYESWLEAGAPFKEAIMLAELERLDVTWTDVWTVAINAKFSIMRDDLRLLEQLWRGEVVEISDHQMDRLICGMPSDIVAHKIRDGSFVIGKKLHQYPIAA